MALFHQELIVTMIAATAIPAGSVVVLDNAGKAAIAAADSTAEEVVGVAHVGAAEAGDPVTVALPGCAKIVGVTPVAGSEPVFGDRLCLAANGEVTCLAAGSAPEANAVCIGYALANGIEPENMVKARIVDPFTIVAVTE